MANSKFKNFQISDNVDDAVLSLYILANISAIMSQVMRIEEAQRHRHFCWVRGYACVIGQNMGHISLFDVSSLSSSDALIPNAGFILVNINQIFSRECDCYNLVNICHVNFLFIIILFILVYL